jgi:hypothetical protein
MGIGKSGTQKELKESYKKPTVVLDIKRKGLVWLLHILEGVEQGSL